METFVQKHLELLKVERDSEVQNTRALHELSSASDLQKSGQCIPKLQISSHCTGLYGRTVVTFERNSSLAPDRQLPSHSVTNGDIVGISLCSHPISDTCASGIVVRVSKTAINIAIDEIGDDTFDWQNDTPYNIVKLANDVTYRRIKSCLNALHKAPQTRLIDILFGESLPGEPLSNFSYPDGKNVQFLNQNLNDSQKEAIDFALRQRDVALIHGPPGTGKTTTVVEIITQAVMAKQKILACAPSNVAVDNLVEKLVGNRLSVVRLGHPARAMQNIQKYSLDAILSASSDFQIVKSVRTDIDFNLVKLRKTKKVGERKSIQQELKALKKELRDREKQAIKQVLSSSSVVLSTLTSASLDGPLKHLSSDHFDLVVIDECSQAIEAACWIGLSHAQKCVLAGDHLQLPPTIMSEEAAKGGLSLSLMERILNMFQNNPKTVLRMLTTQYRMHKTIMAWSSQRFYENRLEADSHVESHLLRDIKGVEDNGDTNIPLLLIDTAGCDFYELDLADEMSKANEGEADIVTLHVEKLISSGVPAKDIGIISPYNLQVECIRLRLQEKYPKLEIKSVDSFQGREKEAIVISLVRSNSNGEIGFLSEHRRMNVAITRARRHLAVVCDSDTISHDKTLKSLMDFIIDNGELRSASMYDDELDTMMDIRPENLKFKIQNNQEKKSKKPKSNAVALKTHGAKPKSQVIDKPNQWNDDKSSRNEAIKQKMEAVIDNFIKNSKAESQALDSNLSSYERMIIHQLCEKLNLNHASIGEGAERHIVISKSSNPIPHSPAALPASSAVKVRTALEQNTDLKPNLFASVPPTVEHSQEQEEKESGPGQNSPATSCSFCAKTVPEHNLKLHELHCQKISTGVVKKSAQKKHKVKPITKVLKDQLADEDDIDGLLKVIDRLDNTCSFAKCKAKMSTLGQKCPHCARLFCLTHSMPEIHGCGLAAKAEARLKMRKNMATSLNPNSLAAKSKFSRSGMESKLDKKLQEMADKRKAKSKGK